ncbi:MAG: hypothetical protein HOO06_08445 [Bdellovibrionaceae bacterium]|jgi:hypothetical protein|nr:hypothetical protein [Pseudobdellovibrionaceae bacterium]
MKKALLSLLLLVSLGCANESQYLTPTYKPQSDFFYSDYDRVWRATQIALGPYPLKVNNLDAGEIETASISKDNVFQKAHKKYNANVATKYFLKVNLIKGKANGKSVVKVIVKKQKHHNTNFFAGKKALPTDGIEEQMVLYRIKRELQVEKILDKI